MTRAGSRGLRIYVAGPYTNGDAAVNIRAALDAANALLDLGHIPFVPHLTHFWHLVHPRPYEDWLALDEAWLRLCNAVLRLDGESPGADREVKLARRLGLRIYHSISEVSAVSAEIDTDVLEGAREFMHRILAIQEKHGMRSSVEPGSAEFEEVVRKVAEQTMSWRRHGGRPA